MSTHPPGRKAESEWHLHDELEHEADRLVHHPRDEMHRLREEAEHGESGATIGILLTAIGFWVTIAVVVVLGLALLGFYLTK